MNEEFRAMTNNERKRDSSVMMSSAGHADGEGRHDPLRPVSHPDGDARPLRHAGAEKRPRQRPGLGLERGVGELPLRRDDRHPVSVLTGDLPQEATEGEAGVVRLHRGMLRRSGARSPLGRSP